MFITAQTVIFPLQSTIKRLLHNTYNKKATFNSWFQLATGQWADTIIAFIAAIWKMAAHSKFENSKLTFEPMSSIPILLVGFMNLTKPMLLVGRLFILFNRFYSGLS